MSKNISKKNEKKLKVYLEKIKEKKKDVKPKTRS